MGAAYLSVKGLNQGTAHPLTALRHNLREIQAELGADSHINPHRTHLNQVTYGHRNAKVCDTLRKRILQRLDLTKPRKNAVHAIEIMVSIPPHAKINQLGFFIAARDWIKANYGGLMFHAVIHNDEEAPHMHVILLPIVNKRLKGNELKGNRNRYQKLQKDFYEQVSALFGFDKPRPRSTSSLRQAAQAVIRGIELNPNLWVQTDFQNEVKQIIYKNPIAFYKYVGFEPNREVNKFVKIMTKPVKPERVKYQAKQQTAITV
jgi:hypothetical protein